MRVYIGVQLANIGSIIEESVSKNRSVMKLFTKLIPVWIHYIYTGYSISEEFYSGKDSPQAGTGQGNKFSGDMCQDKSSFIIKEIENEVLGIILKALINGIT